MIFVWSWREAERRMRFLAEDRAELDRLQQLIQAWWARFKVDLKGRVARLVSDAFAKPPEARLDPVRVKAVARLLGWPYVELARHQTPLALARRVRRNLLGGRVRIPS